MTAIIRSYAAVIAHRPVLVLWTGLGTAAALGLMAALRPLDVQGVIVVPFLVGAAIAVFRRGFGSFSNGAWLTRIATTGMLVRLGFVLVHLAVGFWFYRGEIDFIGWQRIVSDILGAYVQGHSLDFSGTKSGGSLGDMGIGNLVSLVLLVLIGVVTGPTLLGMFPACAVLGALGAYLFRRAHQTTFPTMVENRFLPRALFLLPSVAFWSIFLGKDSLTFFLLGGVTYALARLLRKFRLRDLGGLAVSFLILVGVRPHVAIAVSVGLALALGFRPLDRRGHAGFLWPLKRLALLALVAGAGFVMASQGLWQIGLQELTLEALAERAYTQQRGFARTEAASALPQTMESAEPEDVIGSIPFGVFTLLFRPLPWEAHNVLAVVAAAENVFLMGLVLWRWRSLLASFRAAGSQPFMLYTLLALLAGAITLSFNWNLGTLARHRTMVLPYLLILLAGPAEPPRRTKAILRPNE